MLTAAEGAQTHNQPGAYWCAGCHRFTVDCSHLVEAISAPTKRLVHWQYLAATWERNILQVTMNTGERFQFSGISRRPAIAFVKTPNCEVLQGHPFKRVRGRGSDSLTVRLSKLTTTSAQLRSELFPMLLGKVFHVTRLSSLASILESGRFETVYGSGNSYFKNRGCVPLFDYRGPFDKIEASISKRSPWPYRQPELAILFLHGFRE